MSTRRISSLFFPPCQYQLQLSTISYPHFSPHFSTHFSTHFSPPSPILQFWNVPRNFAPGVPSTTLTVTLFPHLCLPFSAITSLTTICHWKAALANWTPTPMKCLSQPLPHITEGPLSPPPPPTSHLRSGVWTSDGISFVLRPLSGTGF